MNDSLTNLGKEEAIALANYYKKGDLQEIFTSPLGRAKETASYSAEKLGILPTVLPWLEEWSIPVVHTYENAESKERAVWNLPPDILRDAGKKAIFEGEDYVSLPLLKIKERMQYVENGWKAWLENYGIYIEKGQMYSTAPDIIENKEVAFFCHHGFALAFLSIVLHIPAYMLWSSIWLPPTSVSTILLEKQESNKIFCRMVSIGDTSHMASCPEHKSTSGLLFNTK